MPSRPGRQRLWGYLVSRHEIDVLHDRVSYRQVYETIISPDFPAPVATLVNGEIWNQADVDEWIQRQPERSPV